MASNNASGTSLISPEVRMVLSIVVSVLVLLATGLCVLFILRPSPPFPTPKPSPDLPTHTPPAIFTPTTTPSPTTTPGPTATHTPTPSPTPILVSWRELGYLTTIEIVGKTIVEEKGETTIWGTDWILLEAAGKVHVGVDMTQIQDSDVVVEGTSVEIVLPRPTVTSVELLYDQTHAYVNKKKILFSEFTEPQIEALGKAQMQLRSWITNDENWMSLAQEVTRRRLEDFLRQLGFEDIEIIFREPIRF